LFGGGRRRLPALEPQLVRADGDDRSLCQPGLRDLLAVDQRAVAALAVDDRVAAALEPDLRVEPRHALARILEADVGLRIAPVAHEGASERDLTLHAFFTGDDEPGHGRFAADLMTNRQVCRTKRLGLY